MKKLTALLLALMMIVTVFAACGEKPETPATDETQQAQTGDTDTAAVPDAQTDDEETDKEATETVSATGEVVIPSQDPAQTTPASQTDPGTQTNPDTQTKPDTQTAPAPQTKPDTQTTPSTPQDTASSNNSKGLVPASGNVSFIPDWKAEYNVISFGDGFTAAYNMGDIMVKLAEADGIKLKFADLPVSYDNIGTDSTYNFYELFKWDGTEADSKVTSLTNSRLAKPIKDAPNNKVDIFLALVSRDRGVAIPAGHGRNATAMEYYTKALSEAQPGSKTVLIAPSGYQEGNDGALIKKLGLDYTGLAGHNKQIHENTDYVMSKVAGNKQAVYICDAFDYFINNYASASIDLYDANKVYPSMAGSYYMACVIYSSLFGNATSGIPFYGFLSDESAAKTLQEAADKFVSSTGVSLKAHTKTYTLQPLTLEQADPRNLPIKPEYAHEVYPQYYNELLASAFAYYQRTWYIQYDNLNMDQAKKSFSRREVSKNLSPEEATPQDYLYSDCSTYIYDLFVDSFDYDFNGSTRSATIFDNAEIISSGLRVWYYNESTDKRSAEEVSKDFMSVLQPGDVMDLKLADGSGGHIMLYIGNGKMLHLTGRHATGGDENYIFRNKTDYYEMLHAILYDPVEYFAKPGEWLCMFGKKDQQVCIIRPLMQNIKPTTQAKNRLNNLRNVVAYKHTTAPEGVSVNPGDDVTFTFVIRNIDLTAKTITITDKLSDGLSFKSGKDFKVSGKDLTATVTVQAGETVKVPYTVTVDKSVAPGTTISCHNSYLNGVRHNEAPIYVAKTLTADQQKNIAAAADKAGASATSDFDLVSKAYKDGLGITLPYSSAFDAYSKVFTWDVKASSLILTQTYAAIPLFGGRAFYYSGSAKEPERIRHIDAKNVVAGDILIIANEVNGTELKTYLYLGNGMLATVTDKQYVKYSAADSQMIFESLLGQRSFCVLRPSLNV